MARLEVRDQTYLTTVRGMCRSCRELVPARVFIQDDSVWQQSLCPDHPGEPALIAADAGWYLGLRGTTDHAPLPGARPPVHGCPHDCGPCTWHASPCQLPVLSVTNCCNLRCPICFTYNRPEQPWHMPVAEMEQTVERIIAATGSVDLINITGGEPTLHPQLLELLQVCQRPEIGRVTMNSNGIRPAQQPELCQQLAELGVYVILSFDTFDPETSQLLHGADLVETKLQAIDNLTRAGVRLTLLNVMVRGINESAVGGILDLMRSNDQILSLTVQTMTYTGQGGASFYSQSERRHLPVDEAARIVCTHSQGALDLTDFVPRPAAHPLCYLTCFMLKQGDTLLPLTRFVSPQEIAERMRDSYLIRLDDQQGFFSDVINQLYARGESELLPFFRRLIEQLYPSHGAAEIDTFTRQRLAESAVRTVYVHAHMDEDTLDCNRAMLCPDQVPVAPDKMIPACTYNLFYRRQDPRFFVPDPDPEGES